MQSRCRILPASQQNSIARVAVRELEVASVKCRNVYIDLRAPLVVSDFKIFRAGRFSGPTSAAAENVAVPPRVVWTAPSTVAGRRSNAERSGLGPDRWIIGV